MNYCGDRSGPAQRAARTSARVTSVARDFDAVYKHVVDALGVAARLLVGRRVDDARAQYFRFFRRERENRGLWRMAQSVANRSLMKLV
jgi:hypothetical protein